MTASGIGFDADESATMPTSEDDICNRAVKAFHALREAARKNGTAGMSLDEINAEIAAARAEMDAARDNRKNKGKPLANGINVTDRKIISQKEFESDVETYIEMAQQEDILIIVNGKPAAKLTAYTE